MSQDRRYHPKMSAGWFMKRPGYQFFMAREMTSVPTLIYLIMLIELFYAVGGGPEAYAKLMESFSSPIGMLFHVFALAAAIFHSATWFNLTPKVMVVRLGEEKLGDGLVAFLTGYGPWLTVSAFLYWLVAM